MQLQLPHRIDVSLPAGILTTRHSVLMHSPEEIFLAKLDARRNSLSDDALDLLAVYVVLKIPKTSQVETLSQLNSSAWVMR